MDWFLGSYIFVLGLVIGSFLNVLIYRIPLKLSVSKGYSFCPKCNHRLYFVDLFPVFSFLFLKGKCRYCKASISPRYPLVELLHALCYLSLYLRFGISLDLFAYEIAVTCLIAIAFIDIDHKIIPDRFNIIIAALGLILLFFAKDMPWYDRIIGAFAVSVPVLILALVTGGMGEGDVKLFAACGLLLGWKLILLTVLISSVFAAIFGVFMLITKKADRKTAIPFGPFISFGALVSMLFGTPIIQFYLSLILR